VSRSRPRRRAPANRSGADLSRVPQGNGAGSCSGAAARVIDMVNPGDKAPDFALLDQDGNTVKLADMRGRKVLVYFYPESD
jgi:AhpC/TSA family